MTSAFCNQRDTVNISNIVDVSSANHVPDIESSIETSQQIRIINVSVHEYKMHSEATFLLVKCYILIGLAYFSVNMFKIRIDRYLIRVGYT